jgi:D-alanyl-D-alanine dipeptidase
MSVLVALACALAAQAATPPPTLLSTQAVVVTSASWTSTTAKLQRYEKGTLGWTKVGAAVDVVVGEGGMGWGLGLHEFASGPDEPKKMEGDGRAPAGVFRLTRALGKIGVPQTKLPSQTIAPELVCVDDDASAFYNEVVVPAPLAAGERPAWKSSEAMLRKDALYDLVVVVDHNAVDAKDAIVQPLRGRGSCIFLHVWRRPGSPTVGCTAMTLAALTDVVMWLDPAQSPVLIQLPAPIYARVRQSWSLP